MAFVKELRVRFEHVDYARIVYFPRLLGYCHQCFEDFFAAELSQPYAHVLTKRGIGFPAVHTEADFRAPLRFGDVCQVVLTTAKVGWSSLTNRYRLLRAADGVLCAQVTLVTAATELEAVKACAIPEDIRAAFSRHLAED